MCRRYRWLVHEGTISVPQLSCICSGVRQRQREADGLIRGEDTQRWQLPRQASRLNGYPPHPPKLE